MNRQSALIIIVAAGFLAGASMFAQNGVFHVGGGVTPPTVQRRPYTQLMKDIGPTFQSLKKNLDNNSAAAAIEDAVKLEELFKETEAFWAQFNTKDAVDHAKNAQKAFAEISAKAKSNDMMAAQKAYGTIGSICGDCHF